MKKTQKEFIKEFLRRENRWVRSYELRSTPTEHGFMGWQADRRARELAEDGEIERRHNGKYAEYRAKTPVKKQEILFTLRKM